MAVILERSAGCAVAWERIWFLKGAAVTPQVRHRRRNYAQRSRQERARKANIGMQLREKQKTKLIYGVLEKQFRGYYNMAKSGAGRDGREPDAHSGKRAWTT